MCGNCAGGCGSDLVRSVASSKFETVDVARSVLASPLIVEEKPICRFAMANLVAEIVAFGPPVFAGSLADATSLAARLETPVALVDLFTIGFDFEGLRNLISATGAALVAIDDRPNPTFARLAHQAGARGYVCKSIELDRFRAILRAVVDGGAYFPREMQQRPQAGRPSRGSVGLSPRQLDVLKCIAVGMSNQEIARSLGITLGTVKLHIHAILRMTGTRNRTEAALIAGRFLAPMVEG